MYSVLLLKMSLSSSSQGRKNHSPKTWHRTDRLYQIEQRLYSPVKHTSISLITPTVETSPLPRISSVLNSRRRYSYGKPTKALTSSTQELKPLFSPGSAGWNMCTYRQVCKIPKACKEVWLLSHRFSHVSKIRGQDILSKSTLKIPLF